MRDDAAAAELVAFLAGKGLLADAGAVSLEPLTGGYWNAVRRLRGEGRDWVLKSFLQGSTNRLFPVLPDQEAAALEFLGPLELSPEFVAYLPEAPGGPLLVYEFVEGEPWREDVAAAAALFGRLHGLSPPDVFRRLRTTPAGLLEQADAILADAPARSPARKRLDALRPSARDLGEPARLCLVHTDCGPGNLLVGPAGLRLIDWQCPGRGDACEDLACFLSPAMQILYGRPPLTGDQQAAFLATYVGQDALARLPDIRRFFHWRTAAYCLFRRDDLSDVDPLTSARYADALEAELDLLEALA